MSRLFRDAVTLREEVRRSARAYGLPADLRGRLVLSVTDLAAAEFAAGHPVSLTTVFDRDGEEAHLIVTLTAPRAAGPLRGSGVPLPASPPAGPSPSATWRIPLDGDACGLAGDACDPYPPGRSTEVHRPGACGPDILPAETREADEELRAALAAADSLATEHRRLTHELAETNAGVLALFVQLEKQEERVRRVHGQVLRELEDALRPPPPEIDGVELAVHYAPADPAAPTGGDLYDWFALPDGTLHITILDALGHGVRSTRTAITVAHAVRTLALEGHPLESILARTHHVLMPFNADLMATVQLIRLDPVTGELRLANGSHPPPLLAQADGTARYLEARGRGIGFPSPGSDTVLTEKMEPGDLLLLYTDGLTESRRDLVEGEKRLVKALLAHRHRALEKVPGAVAAEMHTVVLHADDTLALAIRIPVPAACAG